MSKKKCATRFCRRDPKGRKHCSTCRSRKRRQDDPVRYAYQNLKDNATRRKKPFTITFEYFRKFCQRTQYIAGKGRTRFSFTVDCKINELGYVPGNIRVMYQVDNARKGTKKILLYDYRKPELTTVQTVQEPEPSDDDF